MQLNPPASEALKLMHKLAADPGIVAIMNKVTLYEIIFPLKWLYIAYRICYISSGKLSFWAFKASLACRTHVRDGSCRICWGEPKMYPWFKQGKDIPLLAFVHKVLVLFFFENMFVLLWKIIYRIVEKRYHYVYAQMTLRVSGSIRASRRLYCMNW